MHAVECSYKNVPCIHGVGSPHTFERNVSHVIKSLLVVEQVSYAYCSILFVCVYVFLCVLNFQTDIVSELTN